MLSITAQNSPRRSDVNDIDVKRKFCRVNSETVTRTFLHCPKERTLIKKTLLILALKKNKKTPTTYIHRQGSLFSLCTTSMVTERLVRAGPPCVAHSFVTLILNIFSSQCREPGSAGKRPEQRHTAVSWWVQILTRDYKSTYKSISTASKVMGHSNTDRVCEQVSFYRFVSKNTAATTEAWKKSYIKVHRRKHGILEERNTGALLPPPTSLCHWKYIFLTQMLNWT